MFRVSTRLLPWLCIAQAVAALLMLFLAGLQPFTVDEIGWLFVSQRALQDHFHINHFWIQCRESLSWDIPWLLLPGRLIASFLRPESFLAARFHGIAVYLALVALAAGIVEHLTGEKRRWLVLACVIAVLFMGALPPAMVTVRPEPSIVFGLFLGYFIHLRRQEKPLCHDAVALALVFLFSSWFFSIHPKAVLFAPAIFCFAYALPRRGLACLCAAFIVLATAADSIFLWHDYIYCPGSVMVERIHHRGFALADDLWYRPWHFAAMALNNLYTVPEHYFRFALFSNDYPTCSIGDWRWLPRNMFPPLVAHLMDMLIGFLFFAALSFSMAGIWLGLGRASRHGPAAARYIPAGFIGLGLLAFMASKIGCTEYEIQFIVPLTSFLLFAGAHYFFRRHPAPAASTLLLCLLLALGTASNATFAHHLWAPTMRNLYSPGQPEGASFSSLHVRVGDGDALLDAVSGAARQCGIALDASSRRVVFDQFTYFAVQNTVEPLYGVTLPLFGPDGRALLKYLKDIGSDGIIMHCRSMPTRAFPMSFTNDNICCIGRQAIESLGQLPTLR